MEDYGNKRASIQHKLKFGNSSLSHHTSLQYGATFFSKNPVFKRNKSSELIPLQNLNKQEIFVIVYRFIGKLVTDSTCLHEIAKEMQFESSDKHISYTKISSVSEDELSEGTLTSGENIKEEEDETAVQPVRFLEVKQQKKRPKTSFMAQSFSDFSSDCKLSSTCTLNLDTLPAHVIDVGLISRIFEQPEPFLINLALCLMAKFLHYSKIPLTCVNACWILSVGTLIAYKIYYDETVEGLVDSFAGILEITRADVLALEARFLTEIGFQAVITSEQYHVMLTKIIGN